MWIGEMQVGDVIRFVRDPFYGSKIENGQHYRVVGFTPGRGRFIYQSVNGGAWYDEQSPSAADVELVSRDSK